MFSRVTGVYSDFTPIVEGIMAEFEWPRITVIYSDDEDRKSFVEYSDHLVGYTYVLDYLFFSMIQFIIFSYRFTEFNVF